MVGGGERMFRIAICDDNLVNLNDEKDLAIKYISQYTDSYSCDTFLSGVELVEDREKLRSYDLILLDWEMDDLNGLDTAKVIREESEKVIIAFVTQYADFAPEGYKVDADRYVIKNEPIFEQQVAECIEYAYKKALTANKYITDFSEGTFRINVKDIIFIESSNHYLYFHIKGKKILKQRNSMDHILTCLDDNMVHLHRNYVVNLRFVTKILNQWAIVDDNGTNRTIPIRRGFEKEFRQRFYDYLGRIND